MNITKENNQALFLNPYAVVGELDIKDGMSVAEFGSGAGHFALSLASRVSKSGRVYAIDLRQSVLEVLEGHIKLKGLLQIRPIKSDLEEANGSTLKEGSQDMVLCANILHQVDHPFNLIKEAGRILREAGRLVVIDWLEGSVLGPPDRIPKKKVEELALEAGFKKDKEFETGNQHYGLIFKK
ncbi:MAG: methyltransferase domain-containing protein [Candidatus Spechtbacterales bacterium]